MPDRDGEQGHSAGLLRALIWAGVGLAPVAAIVVLVGGSDNSVRFAVLLIAVCVVLIGASMLIRSDPVLLRMDVEDRVAEEVDLLREELREQIAAAARATHHRMQSLEDGLGQRRQMTPAATAGVRPSPARPEAGRPDAGRPGVARPDAGRPEPGISTGGRAVVPGAPGAGAAAAVARPPGGGGTPGPGGPGALMPPPGGGIFGSVPRQRGAAAVPPPSPSTRPPMGPAVGAPMGSAAGSSIPGPPSSGPPPSGRPLSSLPSSGPPLSGPPLSGPPLSGPPLSGPPASGPPSSGPMRRPAGPPPGQYGTPRPFGDPAGVGHGPGHGSRGDLRHDDYGDYGDYDDHGGSGAAERSGKRRADVTAVDLGYTGRRHYDDEDDFGLGPDENTGYTDYGAPAPDQYGRTRY